MMIHNNASDNLTDPIFFQIESPIDLFFILRGPGPLHGERTGHYGLPDIGGRMRE